MQQNNVYLFLIVPTFLPGCFRAHVIPGEWIDGQFILHVNNYNLEQGERSVWDQELSSGHGRVDASEVQQRPAAPKKTAAELAAARAEARARAAARPPRQVSAEEAARLTSNAAIAASRLASEGPRRHFFWRHRARLAPFGGVAAEPRPGVDLPGEDLGPAPLPQPPYIRVAMRDYQLEGLRFLAQSHANGVSAILGDEMGLGKTLQTIAFLAWLKFEAGVPGPHLVIAPLSVLSSWMSEFKRFCPELKVLKLHSADPDERDRLRAMLRGGGDFDVVVTTYEMVKSPHMASTLSHRTHWR